MKIIRLSILLLAILTLPSCIQVIFAQSFPLNAHVEWTPNPVSDDVISYTVVFNGQTTTVLSSTCSATLCRSLDSSVPAAGNYIATVSAVNIWGQASPSSTTVKISIPGQSQNIKITK